MNWEQYKVKTGENITLDDKIQDLDNKMKIENFVVDFSNKRIFTTTEPIEGATSPGKQESVAFIIQG